MLHLLLKHFHQGDVLGLVFSAQVHLLVQRDQDQALQGVDLVGGDLQCLREVLVLEGLIIPHFAREDDRS